jgi:D-alanine-D-alanine ligase
MKQVAILFGGKSGEHEVSCRSAASILRYIDKAAFRPVLVGINRGGEFFLQPGYDPSVYPATLETLAIAEDETRRVFVAPGRGFFCGGEKIDIDIVFPVLHGTFGEDGTIQGLLECADLPYAGARVMASAVGFDKEKTKQVWLDAGLPVVPFLTIHRHEFASVDELQRTLLIRAIERQFPYPVFVKPACAGSSVGAGKASDRAELLAALDAALQWDTKALVEPFIPAREIECAILGNDQIEAFGPGEIIPHHEFYDYEAKYSDPNGAEICVEAKLDEESAEKIRKIASAAYRALDCSGLARVDFFIDRENGEIALNEINTIPGFTSISMYPMMCEAGGIPYPELITRLLELAEAKSKELGSLRYQ